MYEYLIIEKFYNIATPIFSVIVGKIASKSELLCISSILFADNRMLTYI